MREIGGTNIYSLINLRRITSKEPRKKRFSMKLAVGVERDFTNHQAERKGNSLIAFVLGNVTENGVHSLLEGKITQIGKEDMNLIMVQTGRHKEKGH